jgi:hypothetical protein
MRRLVVMPSYKRDDLGYISCFGALLIRSSRTRSSGSTKKKTLYTRAVFLTKNPTLTMRATFCTFASALLSCTWLTSSALAHVLRNPGDVEDISLDSVAARSINEDSTQTLAKFVVTLLLLTTRPTPLYTSPAAPSQAKEYTLRQVREMMLSTGTSSITHSLSSLRQRGQKDCAILL